MALPTLLRIDLATMKKYLLSVINTSAGAGDGEKIVATTTSGKIDDTLLPTTATSVGAADAGKIPKLNGSGKIDSSMVVDQTTGSNLGSTGESVFAQKNADGITLEFKKVVAGTNITLSSTADSITISSSSDNLGSTSNTETTWSTSYHEKIIEDAPLAYYRLDDNQYLDSSGNNRHLNLVGTYQKASGKVGYAITLNGSTVLNPASGGGSGYPDFRITGDLTLEVIFKPDQLPTNGNSGYLAFYGTNQTDASSAVNILYAMGLHNNSGTIGWICFHENGTGTNNSSIFAYPFQVGKWYHVIVVRNTTAKTYTLYVNGINVGSDTYANNPTSGTATTNKMAIGSDHELAAGYTFKGTIDDWAFWTSQLTTTDIADHYNAYANSKGFTYNNISFDSGRKVKQFLLAVNTTNDTLTNLTLDGSGTQTQNNVLVLPNFTTWFFEATIVARRLDAQDESGVYKLSGVIDRNGSAATTSLAGSVSSSTPHEDSDWGATAVANTTYGALELQVTGQADKFIQWLAYVTITEVGNTGVNIFKGSVGNYTMSASGTVA